ncbi:hypothetical protein BX666DRAFT_2029161 [Dichotomocladium elegans]|nr:hypothetical protein BX666DRAFT_2029161 [Dichotomocladium elegans]
MPPFSVSSLLNQTPTGCAVDQRARSSYSRPAALDISNLLCSTATVVSKEAGVSATKPLLPSPKTPTPLNSANGFQLPPILHTWPAGSIPSVHNHLPLLPSIPKSHDSNSIWMHDSMASSVSSVASNTTVSSCSSMEPVAAATLSASSPPPPPPRAPVATRALPLKKQPHSQTQQQRATMTTAVGHSKAGTKRAFYDDDTDLESMCGGLVSSDEEQASPPAIKAKRRRANAKQLEVLNRVFDRTVFPSTQLRADLGRQLGMTPRTVQIWFQNRRQAIRTRERQRLLRIVRDDRQPEDPSR